LEQNATSEKKFVKKSARIKTRKSVSQETCATEEQRKPALDRLKRILLRCELLLEKSSEQEEVTREELGALAVSPGEKGAALEGLQSSSLKSRNPLQG